MWSDDEKPKPRPAHVIGADLSKLSVSELTELADELRREAGRVEKAAEEKQKSRQDANAVFKS
jgi:uncharacterized small protein (DUF1192 family)